MRSAPSSPDRDSFEEDVLAAVRDGKRLETLRATGLLDSEADKAFDRLSRLASGMLNAHAAFVSLVDEDRQFLKSCVGVPEPLASSRETPLEYSFCKYGVHRGEPIVISDAAEDPLVRDNPAREEYGIGAYLGIPLTTSGGKILGSFCAVTEEPREWTDEDVRMLTDLTEAVMTEVELRAHLAQREDVEERLAWEAAHDHLTGLPNRTLFFDRLRQARSRAARSCETVAVVFVDLDGFKEVNDRLGHDVGDRLLCAVASGPDVPGPAAPQRAQDSFRIASVKPVTPKEASTSRPR